MNMPPPINLRRHPEPADLLLYQSEELLPRDARAVAKHLASCPKCRGRMRQSEATLLQVAVARAAVERQAPEPLLFRCSTAAANWRIARGAAVAAAGFCLILLLTGRTASARIDALLSQGARGAAEAPAKTPKSLHLRSRLGRCYVPENASGRALVGAAGKESKQCRLIDAAFQQSGWPSENALSLKAYQRWRASLSEKADEIDDQRGLTAVSTSTGVGRLRKATLWVRVPDFRATWGRFEFGDVGAVDVTEVDEPPLPEVAEAPRPVEESQWAPRRPAVPEPVQLENELDEAELRVRLALRALDADADFETAVQRDEAGISVRGVVRTEERRQAIDDALRGISGVRSLVVTEAEEERTQAPVPWMPSFQATEPALAVKRLRQVFPDAAVEQEFSDTVLRLSRRVASYAKARDELATVAARPETGAEATAGREAMDALQARIAGGLAGIANRLGPLIGPVVRNRTVLDATQALDLYREVYSLIFLSGPDHPGLDTSIGRIRDLLGERD